MPLQRLYSQNIPGRIRNFLITIMSGLQLRWAPLPQAVFFASILLVVLLKDVPSSAAGLRIIFGRPAEGPGVLRSPFALMLVLSHLRVSSVAWPKSSEGWHYLRSALAPAHVRAGLRAPSATGPKVVSPTGRLQQDVKHLSTPNGDQMLDLKAVWVSIFCNLFDPLHSLLWQELADW